MGDPKFARAKWTRPSHPWRAERIKEENDLLRKYGLKNKREVWKAQSQLRLFRARARELQARIRAGDKQAEKEREELLKRLARQGLLPLEGTSLDDVLALNVETLLGRRLQTLAYMKGLSFSPDQARQFIVHGHVAVGGRKVTIPGYLVKREEEGAIAYHTHSPMTNDMHPSRPTTEALERSRAVKAAEAARPPRDERGGRGGRGPGGRGRGRGPGGPGRGRGPPRGRPVPAPSPSPTSPSRG